VSYVKLRDKDGKKMEYLKSNIDELKTTIIPKILETCIGASMI